MNLYTQVTDRMTTSIRFLPLLLVFAALPAFAQTGKIAGTVTDASTGEGLPGVNVFIDGTTRGATTNIEGEYVIIGVRPGSYTIAASFIGYATEKRTGVAVNVDLTTTVDFRLREEFIQGEEIVVTAESPPVKKDLTSSEARVTAETIDQLPVTELSQVIEVQAGITNRNGSLHIRGGRSNEVLFMVDGVPVSDTYNGTRAVEVETDGIQELQVISGTFNAEYGNAMSGVINIVTKEGNPDRLAGRVEVSSGAYVTSTDAGGDALLTGTQVEEFRDPNTGVLYADVDPYAYLSAQPTHFYDINFSLDGPVFGDRLTFFALARYFNNEGHLYGARLFNPDGTRGDGAIVPMKQFEKLSVQGNLRFRLRDDMIINLIGLGSTQTQDDLGLFDGRYLPFRWNPDGLPTFTDDGYDVKLRFTHLLSNTTFYTLNLATFYRDQNSAVYDDPFDSRYNDFLINPPDTVLTGGGRFLRGGQDLSRFDRTTQTYMAKFDISSQLGKHHLVKAGVLARVDNLDFESFSLIPEVDDFGNPVTPFRPAIPSRTSPLNNNFQDIAPVTISAYVQDKIEFDSFIVNAGLRLDYFDSRGRIPADPTDPNIFSPLKATNRFRDLDGDGVISDAEETPDNALTVDDRLEYWYQDTEAKIQLSPRLGVAYPITEQGVVHFSFGLFFQIPTLERLFDQYDYKIPSATGLYGTGGNPDLDAQRTTMYEIGFKQGFGDFVFDVTGYYRDVRDWVSTSTPIQTALPGVSYVVFTNRDYANTRGVTLSFRKQFADSYGYDLNYTYQVVDGSNSNAAD
ncbi:MAG: TonB-dependent receptor, partial [Bacteroidota bacterium]